MHDENNAGNPTSQEQNETSATKSSDLLKTVAIAAGVGAALGGVALLLRSLGKAKRGGVGSLDRGLQQYSDLLREKQQEADLAGPEFSAAVRAQNAADAAQAIAKINDMLFQSMMNSVKNMF